MKWTLAAAAAVIGLGVAARSSDSQAASSANIYSWPKLGDGMWAPNMSARFGHGGDKLPLTPAATAARAASVKKLGGSAGCNPIGPVGIISAGFPLKFYFSPGEIVLMSDMDSLWVRHVYMDGRDHSKAEPSYHGQSIGHWEGQTLVIDTVELAKVNIGSGVPATPHHASGRALYAGLAGAHEPATDRHRSCRADRAMDGEAGLHSPSRLADRRHVLRRGQSRCAGCQRRRACRPDTAATGPLSETMTMTARRIFLVCAALLNVVAGRGANAHHSFAMFDKTKSASVAGTIRAFEFTNPHVWIWLDVPAGSAKAGVYGFEGGGPSQLDRLGLGRETFKPGEKVTITYHPLNDGRQGGQFLKAQFPDGTVLDMQKEVKIFSSGAVQ